MLFIMSGYAVCYCLSFVIVPGYAVCYCLSSSLCLNMRSVIVSLHHCVWICGLLLSLFIIVPGYAVCYCLSSSLCLDMRSVIVYLHSVVWICGLLLSLFTIAWICGLLLSLFIIVSGYAVCYCLSSQCCLDMWSANVFSRKGSVCMHCNAYNACNWPVAHGSRLRISIRSIESNLLLLRKSIRALCGNSTIFGHFNKG